MTSAPRRALPRSVAIALAIAALVLAATVFRPAPTPGPFARDFEAYYAAGVTWNAGGDPWSREIWSTERTIAGVDARRDELLPFVGPAAALPLLGAFARLPHALAVRVWTAFLVAGFLTLMGATLALARVRAWRAAIAGTLMAASAAPTISDLALGQIAVLAAAGIACALWAFERGTIAGGAVSLLVAALQPNLALAMLARIRDRIALLGTALALAAFSTVTLIAGGGISGIASYVRLLGDHGRAERFDVIQFTPAAIAWSLGASADLSATLGTLTSVAAVGIVIAATIRLRLAPRDATLLAIAALPFAVPFFHEHDFVVELIPLTIVALAPDARARTWSGIAAGLLLVDWLGLAQHGSAATSLVLQGFGAACAFAALARSARAQRADLAAPLTVLVAAAFAIPIAHAFAVPTWPDTLPVAFHASPAASAAAVWAQEQRTAGLLAQTPGWGVLRAFPLVGCAMLGFAVLRASRRTARYPRR